MKLLLAVLLLPLPALAQTSAPVADITTLTGKTYKSAKIYRVEPDGINYVFAGGMVKIPFSDLPEAVRKAYGYDPIRAATFAAQDDAAQIDLASVRNQQESQVSLERTRNYESSARDVAGIDRSQPMGNVTVLNIGRLETSPGVGATGRVTINARVISIDESSGNAIVQAFDNGSFGAESVRGIVAVHGLPGAVTDDDCVDIKATETGTFSYESALGAAKKVRLFQYAGGSVQRPSGKRVR